MRIISFNVNGIRAACRKGFNDFLKAQAADIVCLQEVKAHVEDIPDLPDHHSFWHVAERKGYSGVGILSRRQPDALTSGMGVRLYDIEGRVLRADYGNLSVVSVYVPSGSSKESRLAYKMRFLKRFRRYLRELLAHERSLIVCGDINIAHQPIDLTNWRQNQKTSGFLPEERRAFDTLLKLGLCDAHREMLGPQVAEYSWWSLRTNARARNVGWRLDYQLATPDLRPISAHVARTPVLSDHAPVIVDYEIDERLYGAVTPKGEHVGAGPTTSTLP